MRILVVGGGAREHALAWTLTRDGGHQLICAPGNPGIAELARCEPADAGDPQALLQLARREAVDLTVVGPELPLSHGIVDHFVADGRLILGPTRAAAALEWSKVFAKDFMARQGVPTARFRVCETADDALPGLPGTNWAIRWSSRPTASPPAKAWSSPMTGRARRRRFAR